MNNDTDVYNYLLSINDELTSDTSYRYGILVGYKMSQQQVKKLNIDDVSNQRELLGKFYIHLSEQAIIDDTCRNDKEMEEAISKFTL